jgi:APA family basic amino acid/polyamine antiporter
VFEWQRSRMKRPSGSLLKIFGLAFGLAVTIGNTIGAGILRTPGDIAALLPSPWMFVGIWIVGALYALLGANALAELGTMMPRNGAQFVFARRAFGDYAGFLVGWMDWISTSAATGAIATVIGESVSQLTRGTTAIAQPVAMAVVVVFTLLLLRGTRIGDIAQQVTSLLKTVALLAIVVACFAFAGRAHVTPVIAVAPPAGVFAAFLLAAQAVIYTFDGWSGAIYFSEELDDPARQIPRSMFYGLLSIALIYLSINIAFIHAVPVSTLAGSPLAAATVASALFGGKGELIVRVIVVIALPSAVNACLLMASRVLNAVSRDGLGLSVTAPVNEGGSPSAALVTIGLVTLTFLATGTFNMMIAIAAFFFVGSYTLSFLAVFVLRAREPNAARPYRAVGHPFTTGFVLLGSLAFLASAVIADRRNSVYALAIVVVSYPVFRLTRSSGVPAPSVIE